MSGRGCRGCDDSGGGCLVLVLLAIFAMPLVGLYFLILGEEDSKVLGLILLIVGIIIWVAAGAAG